MLRIPLFVLRFHLVKLLVKDFLHEMSQVVTRTSRAFHEMSRGLHGLVGPFHRLSQGLHGPFTSCHEDFTAWSGLFTGCHDLLLCTSVGTHGVAAWAIRESSVKGPITP